MKIEIENEKKNIKTYLIFSSSTFLLKLWRNKKVTRWWIWLIERRDENCTYTQGTIIKKNEKWKIGLKKKN